MTLLRCAFHAPACNARSPRSRAGAGARRLPEVAARAASTAVREDSPEVAELVRWTQAGGGQLHAVHTALDPAAGRTLVASQAVDAGQVLVEVPHSRQLSNGTSWCALNALMRDAPTVRQVYFKLCDENSGLRKLIEIGLVVAAERVKGSRSEWRPFLACLPADISFMPLMWREEEVQQLQHGPTIADIKERRRWVLDFAWAMAEDGAAYDGIAIDAELLSWAVAMVTSRTFSAGSIGEFSVMRPVIDFCNHDFAPNCKWEQQPNGMGLVPTQRIAPGEALTVRYGDKSNRQLLVTYGFIVLGNAYECVQFPAMLDGLLQAASALPYASAAAEPQPWQAAALQDWDVLGGEGAFTVTISRRAAEVDPRLLAAARVLCSRSEADLAGRRRGQLRELDAPLAPHIEARALHLVAHWYGCFLAEMGTSAEEDEHLLATRLLPNTQLAVRYRLQLKQIVQAAIEETLNRAASL